MSLGIALGVLVAGSQLAVPVSAAAEVAGADSVAGGPLAGFAALVGTWEGRSDGLVSRLRYRWRLEGHVLEATNDLRDEHGEVVGRYLGAYAWDAGRSEVVFWVAATGGEVHRGRAWWQDGLLRHEAKISGGEVQHCSSALRPDGGRMALFLSCGSEAGQSGLLGEESLVYSRLPSTAP